MTDSAKRNVAQVKGQGQLCSICQDVVFPLPGEGGYALGAVFRPNPVPRGVAIAALLIAAVVRHSSVLLTCSESGSARVSFFRQLTASRQVLRERFFANFRQRLVGCVDDSDCNSLPQWRKRLASRLSENSLVHVLLRRRLAATRQIPQDAFFASLGRHTDSSPLLCADEDRVDGRDDRMPIMLKREAFMDRQFRKWR